MPGQAQESDVHTATAQTQERLRQDHMYPMGFSASSQKVSANNGTVIVAAVIFNFCLFSKQLAE